MSPVWGSCFLVLWLMTAGEPHMFIGCIDCCRKVKERCIISDTKRFAIWEFKIQLLGHSTKTSSREGQVWNKGSVTGVSKGKEVLRVRERQESSPSWVSICTTPPAYVCIHPHRKPEQAVVIKSPSSRGICVCVQDGWAEGEAGGITRNLLEQPHPCGVDWLTWVAQPVENLPAVWENWVDLWVRKIPRRREGQPTPVFLPGEFHGQRSLTGRSPWGHKEWDMTERLSLSLFRWFVKAQI